MAKKGEGSGDPHIEDNPGDVRIIEEAFNDSYLLNRLYTVSDGQEALVGRMDR